MANSAKMRRAASIEPHRKLAARTEVILHIDNQQDIGVGDLLSHGRFPSSSAKR
jgi:hypothetical protein